GTDRTTAVAFRTLGDIFLQIGGQSGRAQYAYQQGLEICQRLARDNPKDGKAQRDLSLCHNSLGDVYLRLGRTADALKAYQDSLDIDQRRARDDPKDGQAQRDLTIAHSKLGEVYLRLGRTADALKAYQDDLAFAQR